MLMAAQTHMGHHTSQWNPANQRYIAGERDGIHIIGLETTAAYLRRAARVVEEVAYAGGLILFVGTRPTHMAVVERASDLAGGFHLFTNWTPGAITNRDVILANSTLAIVDGNDQPLDGFTDHLRDRRPVVPDLVVCLNPMDNGTMLAECAHETIPTIGIIDTNADPSSVTYQIPANDDRYGFSPFFFFLYPWIRQKLTGVGRLQYTISHRHRRRARPGRRAGAAAEKGGGSEGRYHLADADGHPPVHGRPGAHSVRGHGGG